jgi:trimeric autotransporter adhesin
MKRTTLKFASLTLALTAITLLLPFSLHAQQGAAQSAVAGTTVPHLMRFSGVAPGTGETAQPGVVGINFALYAEATGGSPLWMETQNVRTDASGHYSVLLGSTTAEGLPADVFTSEQARWVGVRISGQEEQPRVMLLAVPYALKAGDAETIGGLPPSAFMLATPTIVSGSTAAEP